MRFIRAHTCKDHIIPIESWYSLISLICAFIVYVMTWVYNPFISAHQIISTQFYFRLIIILDLQKELLTFGNRVTIFSKLTLFNDTWVFLVNYDAYISKIIISFIIQKSAWIMLWIRYIAVVIIIYFFILAWWDIRQLRSFRVLCSR